MAIGPVIAMIFLGGLTSFGKTSGFNTGSLSIAGVYVIYLLSFVGGYTSSDLFDYLSTVGEKFRKGTKWH